jgi:hypothetical protein
MALSGAGACHEGEVEVRGEGEGVPGGRGVMRTVI